MIYLPKEKGLCSSINKTLNTIYEIYEKEIIKDNPHNIYIYKNFINNEVVNAELYKLGIKIINDITNLDNNDILIIPFNGISPIDLKYLKEHKINYIDTSCPKLNKLRKNIMSYSNRGYLVIFIGDTYLKDCNALCINNTNELNAIDKKRKLYVIKSIDDDKLNELLINKIKKDFKEVVIENFNCQEQEKFKESNANLKKEVKNTLCIGKDFNNLKEFSQFILNNNFKENVDYGIISVRKTTVKELYNYKYLLKFLLFYKSRLKELIKNQEKLNNTLIDNNDNYLITDAIKSFIDLNQDGKYLRGTLIALGEYFSSGTLKNYLNLATAYETFETSILIHDDIIDNARIRRGKMTIPRKICHNYLNKKVNSLFYNDTIKLANSIAICLGDYGLFIANKIIYDNYSKNQNFNYILSIYNDIVIKTIKGEVLDVFLPFNAKYNLKETTEEDIINVYHLKTSFYTLIGPFKLGCALNNTNLSLELEDILNKIGIYFQIKDDLLGIFGDSSKIGKSTTSDIEEFKQTLLYSYIINTPYKKEFLKLYGKKNLSIKKIEKLKKLLELSKAKDYCQEYLDNLYYDCLDKIDSIELNEEFRDLLKGLLIYLSLREK